MKKLLVIMLALAMTFAMCACGNKAEEESEAGMPNPIHECTHDELVEATGIDITIPDGAEGAYSYIDMADDEPIAQAVFTLDGQEYTYRAQSTAATSITDNAGPDKSVEDLTAALNEGVNVGAALSGMYAEWEASATIDIGNCEGIAAFNSGKEGFVSWLDVAPGVLYCLGVSDNADQDQLMTVAEQIFVPMQGDSE